MSLFSDAVEPQNPIMTNESDSWDWVDAFLDSTIDFNASQSDTIEQSTDIIHVPDMTTTVNVGAIKQLSFSEPIVIELPSQCGPEVSSQCGTEQPFGLLESSGTDDIDRVNHFNTMKPEDNITTRKFKTRKNYKRKVYDEAYLALKRAKDRLNKQNKRDREKEADMKLLKSLNCDFKINLAYLRRSGINYHGMTGDEMLAAEMNSRKKRKIQTSCGNKINSCA